MRTESQQRRSVRLANKAWPLLLLLCCPLVAAGANPTGDTTALAARLDAVLSRQASAGAIYYARVIELPSQREIYARRADEPTTPASNLKLLTSATGLDLFGAQHTFKTYLALDGDDLWLIGTGDPGTGDPRLAKAAGGTPVTMLEAWAEALKKRGVKRIAGDLVYYDGALDKQLVHPAWPKGFLTHWYAAPVSGLNFNDNTVDFTVWPGTEGQPAHYAVMPPVNNLDVTNECLSGVKKSPSVSKTLGELRYRLGGGCRQREELMSQPIDDPGAFFAEALRVQLEKQGIAIAGRIRRAEHPLGKTMPPPPAKVVAVYETPITDVLARINKNSQNMFAECLCKLAGQAYAAKQGHQEPGSWAGGAQAVRAFLKGIHLDDAKLEMIDGSGLSNRNRVTTQMLSDLLAVMFARPDGEVYRASLSIAGVDGSLRNRMPGLKGRVLGKTGSIGGVSSTSGYIRTANGQWLAFSFIFNRIPSRTGADAETETYTKLQDEACAILADWPDLKPASKPSAPAAH